MGNYLLTIDQGTTGTKLQLYSKNKEVVGQCYKKHTQCYPKPGWVEHDPFEIWSLLQEGVKELLSSSEVGPEQIEAIGISNQGETVVAWNGKTGETFGNAVVWSCKRSQEVADQWEMAEGWSRKVIEKTGLRIDPYFSATKIKWLINQWENPPEELRVSTLDAWLLWKLTGGKSYVTDTSTAARTLLFNIYELKWDGEILDYLGIKEEWLPKVLPTESDFGESNPELLGGIQAPILVSIVDQPAALYGHLCNEPGTSKCTYGTGCFTYLNVGNSINRGSNTMLSTIVWNKQGEVTYAFDGPVFSAGSVIEWAKDSLNFFDSFEQLQDWSTGWYEKHLAEELDHSIVFIPALSGLGAPHWDPNARGSFSGLSHAASKQDLVRAILEGIAHMVADVFEDMMKQTMHPIKSLKVDGGLTRNSYLMQFQADLLNVSIEVPKAAETTSQGVAYMLGEACGWWNPSKLTQEIEQVYLPQMSEAKREELRAKWGNLIRSTRN